MGTLDRLIKRFQQLLGGDQEDRNYQSQKQEVNPNEIEGHTYGPIADGRRTNESRVLYHYPKQGKFRFPLIEDEEENNRAKRKAFHVREEELKEERKKISDQKVSQEKKVEVQKVDTRFGNRDFKLTSVPSPVYGFRGREETKSRIGDTLTVSPFENKKQQDTSEIPSTASLLEKLQSEPRVEEEQKTSFEKLTLIDEPDFVEELLPNEEVTATLETETTKESIIETETVEVTEESTINSVEVEEIKASTTVPAAIEAAEKSSINSVEMETAEASIVESAEGEGTEKKSTIECDESEAAKAYSPIESVGRGADEETVIEFDHEKVVQTVEANQIPAEESRKQEIVASASEKPVELVEESQSESPDVTTPSKSYKKPAIPFNVMMLPQDRGSKQAPQRVEKPVSSNYQFPSIQLLDYPQVQQEDESEWLEDQGMLLEETLQSFHVDAKVVHVTKGPSVTRFEIQPARGVKVNKVTGLTDDIKLALAAKDIRIEAPIPGKNTIGIEVPNRTSTPVFLREILRRDVFVRPDSPLTVALGLDISGQPIVTDLKKMPHGLVAGATGSGKSVCINSVLISLLFKASPDEVKLMLIDPKMVELAPYNGLPHLVTPVITDAKQATAALKWVVQEMERRYELFSQQGVRDVGRYNSLYSESPDKPALPYILVVIDELADLMMVSPQDVEDAICRIAQKARACGIHLLLATQRPSVDVITGLIKANIPTRIAFSVSSQTDSRTILDMGGAERLLGRGDMLFHENGTPKPVRVQGTFVSDEEIEDIIAHVKKQRDPEYLLEIEQLKRVSEISDSDDEHFEEACYFVIEQGSASASSLQRKFRVGYNRAARLIDMMEERGIISEAMGSKPRHVLVDEIELEELLYHKEV